MAWLYVPGLADLNSACELQPEETLAWCVTSSGTPSQRPLSWRGWKTRSWIAHLSGTISRPSMAARGAALWISSLQASRASHIALPGSDSDTTTSVRSGPSSCESSKSASPQRCSSRTPLTSSTTTDLFGPSYGAWVSHTRRHCYTPPRNSAGRTSANASLSLLPTPTARSYGSNRGGAAGRVGAVRPSIETIVTTMPTPLASDGHKGGPNQQYSGGNPSLTMLVLALPTPLASQRHARGRSSDGGEVLDEVVRLLPTPTAMDSRSSGAAGYSTESGRHSGTTLTDAVLGAASAGRTGRLNPRLSEWMQGFPVGWTSCAPLEMQSFLMWLQQRGLSFGTNCSQAATRSQEPETQE